MMEYCQKLKAWWSMLENKDMEEHTSRRSRIRVAWHVIKIWVTWLSREEDRGSEYKNF